MNLKCMCYFKNKINKYKCCFPVPCNEKDTSNPVTELDSFIMTDTIERIDTTLQKPSI